MSNTKRILMSIALLLSFSLTAIGQSEYASIRLMWWNLENFFDPSDDSVRNDDDFTPKGKNHWGYKRFEKKKNNIYKTIISMGIDSLPVVVGVCEVENDWTLKQLCFNTPLYKFGYNYVHYDSPDQRGIDVALLYRKDYFKLIYSKPIPVTDDADSAFKTRDILLVSGTVFEKDTLFLLLNHFPSKRGGGYAENKRTLAATQLANVIDTIVQRHCNAGIVVMGDFNDTPFDQSIVSTLGVSPYEKDWDKNILINLMTDISDKGGTYKYQGEWSNIDQIMISKNLHPRWATSMEVKKGRADIYSPNFLLLHDNKFGGNKLYRTYAGPKYEGGFSDHLPVYIDIDKLNN